MLSRGSIGQSSEQPRSEARKVILPAESGLEWEYGIVASPVRSMAALRKWVGVNDSGLPKRMRQMPGATHSPFGAPPAAHPRTQKTKKMQMVKPRFFKRAGYG